MSGNYLIVGRQLEHGGVKYLHDGGVISDEDSVNGQPGTPLTVDFIGAKMVELSQNPVRYGEAGYDEIIAQIKAALVVKAPGGTPLDPAEAEGILANLTVKLDYDTRQSRDGQPDENTRTFVVPVANTLKARADALAAIAGGQGFQPPLTYFLDLVLMTAFFREQIATAIGEVNQANPGAALDDVVVELMDAINDKLGDIGAGGQAATGVAALKEQEILNTPVTAFHRAVGIYITNMCD